MELPTILLVIALLAVLAAAAGAWRRTSAGTLSPEDLASAERRLLDAGERARDSLDAAIRESAQEESKTQRELAAAVERMSADIQKTTVDRFLEVNTRLGGALDDARRSQDERLAKVEVALHEATLASQRSAEGLRVSVLGAAKEQGEAHAKAAADLREGVNKAVGDLTRDLTNSQGEARRSQDDRLGKVEGAFTRFTEAYHQAIDDLKTSLLTAAKEQIQTQAGATAEVREALTKTLGDLGTRLTGSQVEARREQAQALLDHKMVLDDARASQAKSMSDMQASVTSALAELRDAQVKAFDGLQERVQSRLEELRKDNEAKLEKIRSTVEEKLQSTLETRLGESFRQVSEQLEQVYKGLGEMRTLATGVGDLRRVLTNVRSRGTFGEVQLGAILEQVFSPEQYASNVATVPGSSERVEFAVKLPGRDEGGGVVFLPIDAKFPLEDYQRLQQAYEEGKAPAVEEARKALRQRAILEAKTVQEKYLSPPHTTEFALLFVPTEGLYAEILRIPGLSEEMQRRHRVIPVGPTNLHALLNSLQLGFRTLAIEKRSSEVWKVLGAVKTEFAKFGESLDAVSKKLQEAGNKIDDAARRSRAVERTLRKVEALPEGETTGLLPSPEPDAD